MRYYTFALLTILTINSLNAQHLRSRLDDRYDEVPRDQVVIWRSNSYCPIERANRDIVLQETTCSYGDFTHPPKCGYRHFVMFCYSCRMSFQSLNTEDSTLSIPELTYIAVRTRRIAGTRIYHVIEEYDGLFQRRPEDYLNECGEFEDEKLECEGDCTGRIICYFQNKDRSRNDLIVIYDSSVDGEPGEE